MRIFGGDNNQSVVLYVPNDNITESADFYSKTGWRSNSCYVLTHIIQMCMLKALKYNKSLLLKSFNKFIENCKSNTKYETNLLQKKVAFIGLFGRFTSASFSYFVDDAKATLLVAVRKLLVQQMDELCKKIPLKSNDRNKQSTDAVKYVGPKSYTRKAKSAGSTMLGKYSKKSKSTILKIVPKSFNKKSKSKKISMKTMQHIRIKKTNVKNASSLSGDIVSSNNKKYGRGVRKCKGRKKNFYAQFIE